MAWTSGFSQRTELLIGHAGLSRLATARIALFGLGGVGAACALDLVRVGIGQLIVYDHDTVSESNLNRLAFGYRQFIGYPKTKVLADSALAINPEVKIDVQPIFLTETGLAERLPEACDFYIDCIDSLKPKANLVYQLVQRELPFITAMGTACRLDPSRLRYGWLWDSFACGLARALKQRLRRLGLKETSVIPCVWSDEPAIRPAAPEGFSENGLERPGRNLGSAPFVPQVAGHLLAAWTVRQLLKNTDNPDSCPD